jgi:hypothetical protein
MNVDMNVTDSIAKGFDIENGLLGVERDTFLLLVGHITFENTDNKTRNV